MKKCLKWLILGIALVFLTGCSKNSEVKVGEFTPIIDNDGADPNIFQADGYYYYTKTTGDNVTLWRSKYLTTLLSGEKQVVWTAPNDTDSAWAPELHRIAGVWYIYFAYNPTSDIHQMYVLSNKDKNPLSKNWKLSKMVGMDDKFAIDGTVLTVGDKNYFVWSGWQGDENVAQNLYIAAMTSPMAIVKGQKILISQPQYAWEKNGNPLVNEGPEVIIHKGVINLTYSASGSWDNDYCLGLLTANVGANLLNPKSWIKQKKPIFEKTADTFGPGHNGFATSEDGKENWLIFHTARWNHGGWNREVRLQEFTWTKENTIKLSAPLSAQNLQKLPSGEPERIRLAASNGSLSGDLKVENDEQAVEKKAVVGFENFTDKLTLDFKVDSGVYTLIVYVKTSNQSDVNSLDALDLTINGKKTGTGTIEPSQYYQPVQFTVNLSKTNQLTIQSDVGGSKLAIDRVELIKE